MRGQSGHAPEPQLLFRNYLCSSCQVEVFSEDRCAADLLGFELLTYSYAPTGFPTPVWANVVDSEI